MSEQRFAELRTQLEADAWQPEFEQLRTRRTRRTQRYALALVAAAVAVTLVGASLSVGLLRGSAHGPVPAGPSGTTGPAIINDLPSEPSSPPAGAPVGPVDVLALTAAGGRIVAVTNQCTGACDGSTGYGTWRVLTSTDLGATWQTVTLDTHFAQGTAGVWATDAGGTVAAVADGAELVTLTQSGVAATFTATPDNPGVAKVNGSAVGGVVWVGWGRTLVRVVSTGEAEAPWGLNQDTVRAVAGLTPDRALYAVVYEEGKVTWRIATTAPDNRTVGDPCAGTPFAGTSLVTTAVAHPAGSAPVIWATCAGEPATGQQPKAIVTSTDGEHWASFGTVESSGYADQVVPFSATGAWRYGGRADIYRTTDGRHWTTVAQTAQHDGPKVFAALDMNRAIYLARADNDALTWYSTTDGGAHWSSHPFTG